ncbi:transmembrane protein [Salix suchowensis]|nr:transmembrane protein [Salix suchowensis]
MTFLREITTSTAFYVQLSIILLITIMQHSEARELRPSDHGLEYQSLPPTGAKLPPHMKHFFGASNSATRNTMPPSTGAALPTANSSDSSWWRAAGGGGKGGGGRSGGGDHVKHLLLVASLVCGVAGLGLLVSSAFICYHFIRHKTRPSSSSSAAAAATYNNHRSITVYDAQK